MADAPAHPYDLTDRVAIVTGAGGGIGTALARRFAAQGARLALVDRNGEVEALAAELGPRHRAWRFDITDAEAIARFTSECAAHFGRIDILLNNAGIGILAPAESLAIADWDLTLAVNLRAPYLFARAVAPHMLSRHWGRIVTISSQAAVIGIAEHVAYSASKAGLLGMTNCLALEWGPMGITANCISPTVVETPLAQVGWAGEKGERARAEIPTRRFARPEEIAEAALYLASEAAAMVNGANLMVDGGFTIR
ncbi:D-threitol dehydrogenase [Arsenicitalea aurantiaca]|uniref:D-threitol dehydrogenase n=1 Tax=Arsenicitalea aurantiaca TaxID=1783274 RepID=A0A433XBC1_9HYPH|nr:D-threitol dehydrogenase [Arsenicitalea aurantiaca]RUT31379.1 D-threitol dehydrogenase [Arsenicitalea aurantiaca]